MDVYTMADTVRQFVSSHPQLSSYIALMISLTLTGRVRLVLLGGVLGLTVFYAHHIGTACAAGHLAPYHGLIALSVSVTAIAIAARYAFR